MRGEGEDGGKEKEASEGQARDERKKRRQQMEAGKGKMNNK